jgi:hypothetical protein
MLEQPRVLDSGLTLSLSRLASLDLGDRWVSLPVHHHVWYTSASQVSRLSGGESRVFIVITIQMPAMFPNSDRQLA